MQTFTHFKVESSEKVQPFFDVEVTFMHGDADGYTTNSFQFQTEEEVLGFQRELKILSDMDVQEPDFESAAKLLGYSAEDVSYMFYDIFPHDITCDNYRAQYDFCTVFYVDSENRRMKLVKIAP